MLRCRKGLPVVALAFVAAGWADASPREIEIIAPGATGGGWDQTARAMKDVLEVIGAVDRVLITNSPGAGGTIGLAEFVNRPNDADDVLLVSGQAMVGAISTHGAAVSLREATPLARLTGEYLVIAVPNDSDYDSLEDLLIAMRAGPGPIAWAGGSRGGPDQQLVQLLCGMSGVEPLHVSYVPFTGGASVAEAVLAGRVPVGVSGWGEFAPYIDAGRLRPLALSSEQRLPNVDVPTLRELGLDLVVANWRGVFGAPGLAESSRRELMRMLERMVHSHAWGYVLRRHRWTDFYLAGDDFARFVDAEEARLRALDTSSPSVASVWRPGMLASAHGHLRVWLASPSRAALTGMLVLAFVTSVYAQRSRSRRREGLLSHDLEAARRDAERGARELEELHRGMGEEIERQFEVWSLTTAEREVATLMLKGLKHREIAGIRNTSERTVRQQALSIYKKAGLDGRTDLAAYFLEDLLPPHQARSGVA